MAKTKDEGKGKCATTLLHRAMCLLYGAKCVSLLFANTASLESIDELNNARKPRVHDPGENICLENAN